MNVFRRAFPVLLPVALAACGPGVVVKHLKPSANPPQMGIPWYLGMTQFNITVTRHLTQCVGELKGTVEVAVVPRNVVDPDQRYIIDAPGRTSTSNLQANMGPSGLSTGLTSEVVDATPQILAAIVKAAATVAVAAGTGGFGAMYDNLLRFSESSILKAPPAKPQTLCSYNVDTQVTALYPSGGAKGLEAKLNDSVDEFNKATAKLTLLTALKNENDTSRKELLAALTDQQTKAAAVDDSKAALAKALKLTTDAQTVVWPRVAGQTSTVVAINDALTKAWANVGASTEWSAFREQMDVEVALYTFDTASGLPVQFGPPATGKKGNVLGTDDQGFRPEATDSVDGLPVRVARTALLVTCAGQSCSTAKTPDTLIKENTVFVFEQPVLQMGDLYFVRMRGGSFKSESAVVKLDDNGNPTSIQVTEKAAAAAGAAGAVQDTLSQLAGIRSAVDANKLAQTKAKTTQLEAESDLATAKAKMQLATQTSQATAQAALINANLAEEKAKSDLDSLNAGKAGSP